MRSIFGGLIQTCWLAFLILLLAGCGGGGGGGFTTPDSLDITIRADRLQMPANAANFSPGLGSPFTVSVIVEVKPKASGAAAPNGTAVQITLENGVQGSVSIPDDPATEDVNEFTQRFLSISNTTASGQAQFYFTSAQPGTAVLIASVQDPVSGRTLTARLSITVGGGVSSGRPQDIFAAAIQSLFVRGTDLPTSSTVQIVVLDEADQPAADPPPGVNNVRVEMLSGGPNAGEILSGFNAKGGEVEGRVLLLATNNGIAQFNIRSGTLPGTVAFRFTVDREDNNIDNGVTNPLFNASAVSILPFLPPDTPLGIVTQNLPGAEQFVFYATLLQAEGGVPPYAWSIDSGALPPGLTLDPIGMISGTPTQAGTFQFVLRLSDQQAGVSVLQVFTLTVDAAPPLAVATTDLADGFKGVSYADVLVAEGGTAPYTWSITNGSLPPGLSLNASTGAISGTPTTVGDFNFVVQVRDANGFTAIAALGILVALPGDTLEIVTGALPDATPGQAYLVLLEATGGVPPYSWSLFAGTLPTGLTINAANGTISGTTTQVGSFDIAIQVRDSVGSTAVAGYTLTVGDGGGGGGGPAVASLDLLVSSPQLNSSGATPVTVTAVVKDINSNLVEGATVTFSTDPNDGGSLQVTRAVTDETGTAEALLNTPGNKTNRPVTVTATSGGISDTVTVQVVGTNITVNGPGSAVLGDAVQLSITLRDSGGNGIANTPLTITSSRGNAIGNPNPTTGLNGQATVTVTANVSGDDTLTVSGAGATAAHSLSVSADSFVFTTPSPSDPTTEVALGTPFTLTVRWTSSNVPVAGQQVNFSTSRGTLSGGDVSASSDLTDANGEASITVTATSAGPATITATAVGGPSTQIQILFIATDAETLDLQANPSVIGTNPPGSDGEQSNIVAVVRDADNNLVKGKTVTFTLTQDITGGTISPSSAVTDAFGRASAVYTAGSVPSAENGVEISATVVGEPEASDTARLTVAQRELFITLGTGNELTEDATRYFFPYNVLVTDAAGGPVANAQVSLSIIPLSFSKGFYEFPVGGNRWIQNTTAGPCPNEDINRNGILDPGEDYNNNQPTPRLDPGNVVTLSQATVTTDADGFALFDLVYAQQFANWVVVELTARASVSGTEATEVLVFALEGIASDFTDENTEPPGNPSPFGDSNSCFDTD